MDRDNCVIIRVNAGQGISLEDLCSATIKANRPSLASEELGALDPTATQALCRHFGVNQEFNRQVSLFANCLDVNTLSASTQYASAVSQFVRFSWAAEAVISGRGKRTEVHGVHTLPACVDIAKLHLNQASFSDIEILKHQISKPINSQLRLVAYEEKPAGDVLPGNGCLFAHLRIDGREVFIRGYETNTPIVYVLGDHTMRSIDASARRDGMITRDVNGVSVQLYPRPVTMDLPEGLEFSPHVTTVMVLEYVESWGGKLLDRNVFPVNRGVKYVSRLKDVKGLELSLLSDPNSELRISCQHSSLRESAGSQLLDISFEWKASGACATGVLTLASAPHT